jgi:glycosyltransferase involved in cell wall biosynthesis
LQHQTNTPIIDVIIPAFNEENAVGRVIAAIPTLVRQIVVVNNNSNDATKLVARRAGAIVLDEQKQGYGFACLKGMEFLRGNPPEILVFIDADFSDYPEQLKALVQPILKGQADLVIGSRALGVKEKGSMTLPQRFGNRLATYILKRMYGVDFTDLGPFRAVRWDSLMKLDMQDKTYGWTVEMQIKAAKEGLRCQEVPVDYRNRIGVSKVSGTFKGVVGAGYKILYTLWKYR